MEVFFLPPRRLGQGEFRGQICPHSTELAEILIRYSGILPCRAYHAFVAILNGYGNEAVAFERCDVRPDLPIADAEKISKITIGCKASPLVVKAADLDE